MGKEGQYKTQQLTKQNNKRVNKKIAKKKQQKKKKDTSNELINEINKNMDQLQKEYKDKFDDENTSITEFLSLKMRQKFDEKDTINDETVDHLKVLEWVKNKVKVCEICKKWESQDRLAYCGQCEDAYHIYCLTPKLKKAPQPFSWECYVCYNQRLQSDQLEKERQKKISDIFKQITKKNQCGACKASLPDKDIAKCIKCKISFHDACFYKRSSIGTSQTMPYDEQQFLCCFCVRQTMSNIKQNATLHQYFTAIPAKINLKQKYPNTLLQLPKFTTDKQLALKCKQSLLFALQTQDIQFDDDLVYNTVPRTANNTQLEAMMQRMEKATYEVFMKFKEFSRQGTYGSLQVIHDEKQGFVVQAQEYIAAYTMICEYVGEVFPYRQQVFCKNDSMMTLLRTSRAQTTLIILPEKYGNLAKYISGINNHVDHLKKKQNLNSVRYDIDGEARVFLYAKRPIKKGEILYYDYNAGKDFTYNTDYFV